MWFYAESVGPEAGLLRSQGDAEGYVLAVVREGIYLESLKGYVVCLVPEGMFEGPLGVRVRDFGALHRLIEGWDGRNIRFGGEEIVIGGEISVGWKQAGLWKGRMPGALGMVGGRREAVAALHAVLLDTPEMGRGGMLASLRGSLEECCRAVERGNYEQAGEVLCGMLGLGEGLTPLGDDMAMGMVVGMVWLAGVGKLDRGWVDGVVGQVREVAGRVTNKISERMLCWAGEGVLYEPAMELGGLLFEGRVGEVEAAARRLMGIGQSTGYGVAMGVAMGMASILGFGGFMGERGWGSQQG